MCCLNCDTSWQAQEHICTRFVSLWNCVTLMFVCLCRTLGLLSCCMEFCWTVVHFMYTEYSKHLNFNTEYTVCKYPLYFHCLMQMLSLTCFAHGVTWCTDMSWPKPRLHEQRPDAHYVIGRALISNPYLYRILCNLLAHLSLQIKSNN